MISLHQFSMVFSEAHRHSPPQQYYIERCRSAHAGRQVVVKLARQVIKSVWGSGYIHLLPIGLLSAT
jgi:hypothetical protein